MGGCRTSLRDAIPLDLNKAIAIVIDRFIAFIGPVNSDIVVRGEGTIVDLAPFTTWPVLVRFSASCSRSHCGARGICGDLLIEIIATILARSRGGSERAGPPPPPPLIRAPPE